MQVQASQLPSNALLAHSAAAGDYVDSFAVDLPAEISLEDYVAAFYTTWLFRIERWILALAGHPSSHQQALALAHGQSQTFAAWKLQQRELDQLLMRDFSGVTCSWFMVQAQAGGTRLYFGSGVKARQHKAGEPPRLPAGYSAFMGVHVLYSRALLAVTARRLMRAVN